MDEEHVQVPNNTFSPKTVKMVEFVGRMFCLSSLGIHHNQSIYIAQGGAIA